MEGSVVASPEVEERLRVFVVSVLLGEPFASKNITNIEMA